jgi:ribonuclease HI
MHLLYTDGSCLGNPGKGGWAARCVYLFDISGGDPYTTNNIMEMTAVIRGLEECLKHLIKEVSVHTDSNYVKTGMKHWVKNWQTNGWKTASGTPVKNKELWIRLCDLERQFDKIQWIWVKAHNGDVNNEYVDKEARRFATSFP